MSNSLVQNDVANAAPSPESNGTYTEVELTPERKENMIARAKEVIAGRLRPEPIVTPPEVEEYIEREYSNPEYDPPPTPECRRREREHLSLLSIYRGCPIATFRTADGSRTVLAAGMPEIRVLLKALSDDESLTVIIEHMF